jgi:hypothetical protein
MTIYLNRLKAGSPEGVHWVTAGGSDGWNGDGRLRSCLWPVQRRRCRGGASSEMEYGDGRDRWHIQRRPKEWASSIVDTCGGQWYVRQIWIVVTEADGIMPGCATCTHRNHQTRKTNTACVSVVCVMCVAWCPCHAEYCLLRDVCRLVLVATRLGECVSVACWCACHGEYCWMRDDVRYLVLVASRLG